MKKYRAEQYDCCKRTDKYKWGVYIFGIIKSGKSEKMRQVCKNKQNLIGWQKNQSRINSC